MQGQLDRIDIHSILQLMELGQQTGELVIASRANGDRQRLRLWSVLFTEGMLLHATEHTGDDARLSDYLGRYKADTAPSPSQRDSQDPSEYGQLCQLLERQDLTPAQGDQIVQNLLQETLFDLLPLRAGTFTFIAQMPFTPILAAHAITPLISKTFAQLQEWYRLAPYIQSPDQCPTIAEIQTLRDSLSETTVRVIERYADGQTSIRRIARFLNRPFLTVARAIYPYVQKGVIHLTPRSADSLPANPLPRMASVTHVDRSPPKIVCISDSETTRQAFQASLSEQNCDVTTITSAIAALSLVMQLQPDLVLCDRALSDLAVHELCTMFRVSTALQTVPIVLLGGADGLTPLDLIRDRLAGVTKSVSNPAELIPLVQTYVTAHRSHPTKRDNFFVRTGKDGLEIDRTDATSLASTPFHE